MKNRKQLLVLILFMAVSLLLTACSNNPTETIIPNADTSKSQDVNAPITTITTKEYDSTVQAAQAPKTSSEDNPSITGLSVKASTKITSSKKRMVAIDAGHQSKGNYAKEPIGPGAKTTKPKVSSGTQGVYTKVPEYKLTLAVAKKVEKELLKRGYEVYMIRETNNVNLSNKERAAMANKSGADIFIRIHADGSTNKSVSGTSTLYPSKKNPYVPKLSKPSYTLSKLVVDAICEATASKNRGAIPRDDMSGINWCKLPVTIIEMGYMTNKTEDKLMQTEDYQNKIAKGICDGIDEYFEELERK
jgi:N-acetylmuramoyl-L-alanine amidase